MAKLSADNNSFDLKKEISDEENESNSAVSGNRIRFCGSGKGGERVMLRFARLLRLLFRVLKSSSNN